MKKYILLAGIVFVSGLAMAQGGKIVAERSGKGAVVMHAVQPKEGLYSIARSYNVTIGDLAAANKLDKDAGLNIGQKLKIPLKSLEQTRFGTGAPVYYVVQGKENLNSISIRFAKMPVKNIMIWNNLKEGESVKRGQEIIVGYLPKGIGSSEQITAKQDQQKEPAKDSKKNTKYQQATVTGTNINIRKGPSTDQDVVGIVQENDVVDIVKKVNSEWTSIRTKDGVEGYIASQFVQAGSKKAEAKKKRL
ncbi:LysM peptidoglycan-binding domain-containing protein [Niabella ginsengisoli]|uniref:LysM peptidoglycan-binding domain-containing protein n=1 Tax=Niabella ginsengisoli TaxID=522298 RepID=A0ABS9SIZ8_9BACT|nr:LysM peptidoglycan-binding domain-containing protein [Niabella ginsengisoli]MCH5598329.1 LysM peptidoglycan-binding domain-containing protein [Niabella ginsengisoli]